MDSEVSYGSPPWTSFTFAHHNTYRISQIILMPSPFWVIYSKKLDLPVENARCLLFSPKWWHQIFPYLLLFVSIKTQDASKCARLVHHRVTRTRRHQASVNPINRRPLPSIWNYRIAPQKRMVGLGWPVFQVQAVSFRECSHCCSGMVFLKTKINVWT